MREIRNKAGLTQTQLAEKLGVQQAAVSKLESALKEHELESVLYYLHALGADLLVAVKQGDDLYQVSDNEGVLLVDIPDVVAQNALAANMSVREYVRVAVEKFSGEDDGLRTALVKLLESDDLVAVKVREHLGSRTTQEVSESRRQKILENSIGIYESMVQACINAGQIEKAFEYSERSRSKRLVDLMASYNLSQGEEIPPKVQELLQQYEELQQQIDQERQSHKSENKRSETRAAWEERNQKVISLETQKQQVWENLRREDPVLAGEIQVNPLSLSEIQKLLYDQPNTAILSFYTTNSDTHIFIPPTMPYLASIIL